jgi:hypothetical protein
MQRPAPRTRAGWSILLFIALAAASTARAGVIFDNDITGSCGTNVTGGHPTGSAFGAVVSGGSAVTLWGNCSMTSAGGGATDVDMSWWGMIAPGSSLTGDFFPFSYDFSIGAPPGAVVHWAIVLEILGLNHASPEYLLGQGVTAPGGGNISYSGAFATTSMTPTVWVLDFAGWFDAQPLETITLTVPSHSSIDLNNPASNSAVPEPSGALLMLTGLGGTLLLAGRPRLLK